MALTGNNFGRRLFDRSLDFNYSHKSSNHCALCQSQLCHLKFKDFANEKKNFTLTAHPSVNTFSNFFPKSWLPFGSLFVVFFRVILHFINPKRPKMLYIIRFLGKKVFNRTQIFINFHKTHGQYSKPLWTFTWDYMVYIECCVYFSRSHTRDQYQFFNRILCETYFNPNYAWNIDTLWCRVFLNFGQFKLIAKLARSNMGAF